MRHSSGLTAWLLLSILSLVWLLVCMALCTLPLATGPMLHSLHGHNNSLNIQKPCSTFPSMVYIYIASLVNCKTIFKYYRFLDQALASFFSLIYSHYTLGPAIYIYNSPLRAYILQHKKYPRPQQASHSQTMLL